MTDTSSCPAAGSDDQGRGRVPVERVRCFSSEVELGYINLYPRGCLRWV